MRSGNALPVPPLPVPPKQLRNKKPNLDSLTTVNADGSRYFLHPSDVKGRFTVARRWFGWLLIAVYVLLPWIQINGAPALFLDVENRRFHMFGLTLLTQDMWVFFFALSGMGFVLFFITAILGRLWCGWACPYTVFLEHVFRRVERWIDGDAPARRSLDAAPNNTRKIIKRTVKWTIYTILAAAIAHVFISYFVSVPRLYEFMRAGPMEHLISFGVVTALTGILLFCFASFREQFCIILCPYGRIQSALTDDDTVVIGYDEGRGEPRGKASDPANGDCIDCFRCVQVCPTGIDIRNGLQYECIGCGACADVCDTVMDKMGYARGLVKYSTENAVRQHWSRAQILRHVLRPRVLVYTAILGTVVLAMLVSLVLRPPFRVDVERDRGALARLVSGGKIENVYRLQIMNATEAMQEVKISAQGMPGLALASDGAVAIAPTESRWVAVRVQLPYENAEAGSHRMEFVVESLDGQTRVAEKSVFIVPR